MTRPRPRRKGSTATQGPKPPTHPPVDLPDEPTEESPWNAEDHSANGYSAALVLRTRREKGWSVRKAADHFGIPYETVRDWFLASGGKLRRPEGRPRSGWRGPEGANHRAPGDRDRTPRDRPADEPDLPPVANLANGTYRDFLVARLEHAQRGQDIAVARQSNGVARSWETLILSIRRQLEDHDEELRRKAEAEGRAERIDPDRIAARALRSLGVLARVAPEAAADVLIELGRILQHPAFVEIPETSPPVQLDGHRADEDPTP